MRKLEDWEPRAFFPSPDLELDSINMVLGEERLKPYLKEIKRIFEATFYWKVILKEAGLSEVSEMLTGKEEIFGILNKEREEWDGRNVFGQIIHLISLREPLFDESVSIHTENSSETKEPLKKRKKGPVFRTSKLESPKRQIPDDLAPFVDYLDERFAQMFQDIPSNTGRERLRWVKGELVDRILKAGGRVDLNTAMEEFFDNYSAEELANLTSFEKISEYIRRLFS